MLQIKLPKNRTTQHWFDWNFNRWWIFGVILLQEFLEFNIRQCICA